MEIKMTKERFDQLANRIWDLILKTRDDGQKEYARSEDDVHANFKRCSDWMGDTPMKSMMYYMLKHIDGVVAYINGHKSQREDVRGRLKDIIVYSLLMWAWVEDSERD